MPLDRFPDGTAQWFSHRYHTMRDIVFRIYGHRCKSQKDIKGRIATAAKDIAAQRN